MKFIAGAVLSAVLFCAGGCFEAYYVSGAPDGTILVSAGGLLCRVDAELTEAELLAEGVARAEYSPDGQRLLCVFVRGEEGARYGEVALCSADAKVETVLARLDAPEGSDESGTFDGGMAMMLMRPRWSADGRYVSWLWYDMGGGEFFVLSVREVEGEVTLEIPRVSYGYAWSGDSTAVAVIRSSGDEDGMAVLGTVQVIDIPSGDKRHEPAGVFFNGYLCLGWGPEDKSILFSANTFEMPVSRKVLCAAYVGTFSVDLEGGGVTAVTPSEALSQDEGALFAVSPDGEKLLLTVVRSGGEDTDVYTISTDGTGLKRIQPVASMVSPLRWLPGGKMAYGGVIDDEEGIYIVDTNGARTDILPLIKPLIEKHEAEAKAKGEEPPAESDVEGG